MNPQFRTVLSASSTDRKDLFVSAGNRLGTAEQNVEKDFWVCWALDALFNNQVAEVPRLLFKGGTSLSKGYGLIERFSEDIDITVFREDIGQAASVQELEGLSGKKRQPDSMPFGRRVRNTSTALSYPRSTCSSQRPWTLPEYRWTRHA
jgi:hypothetical protein